MEGNLSHIYIGAEGVSCPLGLNLEDVWKNILQGNTGLRKIESFGFDDEDLILCKFSSEQETSLSKQYHDTTYYNAIFNAIDQSLSKVNREVLNNQNTIVIFSTTKSEISNIDNEYPDFKFLKAKILAHLNIDFNFDIVSNACISGVSAIILAHDLIKCGKYENAIVIGADEVSPFTTYGFQSFFALSDDFCKPFDKNRKGINLGEAAACVVLSNDSNLIKSNLSIIKGGAVANDANHISGPSRTGEGLYRSVRKTEKLTNQSANTVDFISAHGTSTNYNDEMESIAFSRLNCSKIPLNSLKGYFGHTLGAAGLIEFVVSNQSLHQNTLVKSLNFEEIGTSEQVNIIREFQEKELKSFLKTASGFGGCNASIIVSK